MARFYMTCPTCRRRMRLVGISTETFSQPAMPVERYYRCSNCEDEWTYNVEQNVLNAGVPAKIQTSITYDNN
jgi:hypothetical protein